MRGKLIEYHQENLIECDYCDHVIPNYSKSNDKDFLIKSVGEYLNVSCPNCKENLLTDKDFRSYKFFLRVVSFVNKYLWWLGYFATEEEKSRLKIGGKKEKE